MNPQSTKDWDEYKHDFLRNVYAMLNCFMPLSEKQADYLAELYDKYSK